MQRCYNKKGEAIDLKTFAELLEDREYVIIKQETLANGMWVSTVWLGIDYGLMEPEPIIFETMVFPRQGDYRDVDMQRYSTEEAAIKGHKEMVLKWSGDIKG